MSLCRLALLAGALVLPNSRMLVSIVADRPITATGNVRHLNLSQGSVQYHIVDKIVLRPRKIRRHSGGIAWSQQVGVWY
jgi:hypothetical protein